MSRDHESIPSVWKTDYQRHLQDLIVKRMRIASPLFVLVSVLNGGVILILTPTLFYEGLWSWGVAIPLFMLLFALTYVRAARRGALALSFIAALLVIGFLETIIVTIDGYHSPAQIVLGIAIIAWALLFPYSLTQTGIVCLLAWGVYLVPSIIGGRAIGTSDSAFHIAIIFSSLIGSSVVALGASHMISRLRRQEFFSRQALKEEQAKSERLLLNILPELIAQRLKDRDEPISDGFSEVTVLFADIVGFTPLSEHLPPQDVVALLNDIFSRFDELTEKHGLEKIKTIGDAYMAVSGLPVPNENHAEVVAETALDMVEELSHFNKRTGKSLDIRIGINSGPVVAGVIGKKKFIYDLWGDTVNTASRMESHGVAGKIQVTEATYNRLCEKYEFEERGVIRVKGKGEMQTFFLKGRR